MTPSDQSLLQRFASARDEAAFQTVVERHQELVLGACRRVLGNVHDAEDAAQAAFLILAKKAGSVSGATLAGWLHRVATNCAKDAWQARRLREHHQREASAMPPPAPARPLSEELDGALCALPEAERAVIVQFHLEGQSLEAIATGAGRPVATIGYWLQRGRKRLAAILGKRGVTLSATALVGGLSGLNAGEIPAGFAAAITKAAVAFSTGAIAASAASAGAASSAAGAASSNAAAAALAAQGLHAMSTAALIKTAILGVTFAALAGVGGVIAIALDGHAQSAASRTPAMAMGASGGGDAAPSSDAVALPAAPAPPAAAATVWKPQAVGAYRWHDAASWSGALPDGAGANAEIDLSVQGRMAIDLGQGATVERLTVGEHPGKADFAAITLTGSAPLTFAAATPGATALLTIAQGDVPNGPRLDLAAGIRLGGTSPLIARIASPAVFTCQIRSLDLGANTFVLEGARRWFPGDAWKGVAWEVQSLTGSGHYIQNGAGTVLHGASSGFTGALTVNNGDFTAEALPNAARYAIGGAFMHKNKYPRGGSLLVGSPAPLTALPPPRRLNPQADLVFTGGGYFALTGQVFDELAFVGQPRPAVVERVRQIRFLSGISELKVGNGNDVSSSTTLLATDPAAAVVRRRGATALIGGGDITSKQGYEGSLGRNERLLFASGMPSYLKGGGGAPGTKNRSIIPWMVIGTLYHPGDGGFATYDEDIGVHALRKEEYESVLLGAPDRNVRVDSLNLGANREQTVNSLFCGGWGNTDIGAGSTLTISSGALKLGAMGGTSIGKTPGAAGTINFGPAEGIIHTAWVTPYGDTTIYSTISGSGGLTKAGNSTLILVAANTYTGPTCVSAGVLQIGDGASAQARLGAGDVEVAAGTALAIKAPVADAILDTATVTLLTADNVFSGVLDLGAGVNEVVGALVLDGQRQAAGTYGSSASSAVHKNDQYFAGPGILTVSRRTGPATTDRR